MVASNVFAITFATVTGRRSRTSMLSRCDRSV
jgi:hypothetical protein